MNILDRKTALVTGGSQGIGRGIAIQLAAQGANVIIGDLNPDIAQSAIAEIQKRGGSAKAVNLDVTDTNSINQVIEKILADFSALDILVNNAGVVQKNLGDKTCGDDFDLCCSVNLKAIWLMAKAISPHFQERSEGKIINIASISGRLGSAQIPAYSASKAAVINLTQALALSLSKNNVNVNAICPGSIWTPMWEKMDKMLNDTSEDGSSSSLEKFEQYIYETTALKRAVKTEDIGNAVVFLASSMANSITGQSINVDAGAIMS